MTPGDKRIEVSWDEPEELGRPAIDTYYAGFRKAGTTSWVYVGRTNTSVTLEGLENGVEYEVQVSVSNSQGDAIAGPKRATPAGADSGGGQGDSQGDEQEGEEEPEPADTPTATSTPTPTAAPSGPDRPPSAPRNLQVTPGDKRIEVSWDEPEELGRPAIDTYYAGFRKAGTTSWVYVGRTNTSVTLEGLENGVEYEVQVSVSNSQGDAIAGPKRATPNPPTATPEPTPTSPPDSLEGVTPHTPTPVPPTATATPTDHPVIIIEEAPTATATPTSTATPFGPDRPPSAPRNLLLTPGDGKIEVSWDEPEELGRPAIDTYYAGFRKAGANTWTYVGRTNTSVTLKGLENGVEYEVQVSVSNSHGDAIAGPKRATPNLPTATLSEAERPPSAPRNLLLTPGDGKIEVSWDEPEELGKPAIDHYYVGYRKAGANDWGYLLRTITSTSATIGRLENGVEYEVQVSVSNGHGDAIAGPMRATPNPPTATPVPPTAIPTATPTPTPTPTPTARPPSAPRNLLLTPGDGKIEVSWDAPEDLGDPAIDHYYVGFRKVGAPRWRHLLRTTTSTSATLKGLDNGVEYEVQVSVSNGHGDAIAGPMRATPNPPTATPVPPTAIPTATPTPTPTPTPTARPPSAPRNLLLTPGDGKIVVSWDAPEDLGDPAIERYFVRFRKVGANRLAHAGDTSTSVTLTGLENGVEYEVWVTVGNRHGTARAGPMRATPNPPTATPVPPTAIPTATPTPTPTPTPTARPPSAPRNLLLTPGDGKIVVSWDAPEDLGDPAIERYFVRFRKVGANRLAHAGDTSTSVTLTGLENGVEYEVWVTVGNRHGTARAGPMRATPNPPTATPVPP
ncbi:MAG: fibronectin type III domain-containing protein, partial [bacterium]|nr:fibronectin type III domain-containing protein [bacterium]